MGANAQTTVQKFVDGAVLTAAQQNFSAATGVPVFATTVTRDAAFGGANKVLAEGQLAYIEASGIVQYYTGAAWATVGPAAAAALVYITGASFTAQTAVSLPADTFSATYRNYRITYDITAAAGNTRIDSRLRAAGADITASNYATLTLGINSSNTASPITTVGGNTWFLEYVQTATPYAHITLDVYAPQVTAITKIGGYSVGADGGYVTAGHQINGFYAATTSADSLSINSASTITGSYKVYGYSNS